LVVDEVLAVGDAEFQKKAIGKMKDVSQGQGRTVLFVSHNMASIRQLCTRGILLEKGMVTMDGDVLDVVNGYLTSQREENNYDSKGSREIVFEDFKILNDKVCLGDDIDITFNLRFNKEVFSPFEVDVCIFDNEFRPIVHTNNLDCGVEIKRYPAGTVIPGRCRLKNVNITPGIYNIVLFVGTLNEVYQEIRFCMEFVVEQGVNWIQRLTPYPHRFGTVLQSEWEIGDPK
jgi:lipopolysaccharide transport system ATP-binding protein